jgi:hypothetical protein
VCLMWCCHTSESVLRTFLPRFDAQSLMKNAFIA